MLPYLLIAALAALLLFILVLRRGPHFKSEVQAFRDTALETPLIMRKGGLLRPPTLVGRFRGRRVEARRIRGVLRIRVSYEGPPGRGELLFKVTNLPSRRSKRSSRSLPGHEDFVVAEGSGAAGIFLKSETLGRLENLRDILGQFELSLFEPRRSGRGNLALFTPTVVISPEDLKNTMETMTALAFAFEETAGAKV